MRALLAACAAVFLAAAGPVARGRSQSSEEAPTTVELVTSADADDARSVRVVALHPWGGRPRAFARSLGVDTMGCRARWSFPSGPLREGSGFAWLTRLALDPDANALAGEARAQAAVLARLIERDDSEPEVPTLVVGYSQGAMLALSLGVLHSAGVDAVVVAAGALPRALHPAHPFAHPPRFVLVHGEDDAFVPFSEAEALSRAMAHAGAPVELVPLPTGHRFRGALGAAFRREVREALVSMGACGESSARLLSP